MKTKRTCNNFQPSWLFIRIIGWNKQYLWVGFNQNETFCCWFNTSIVSDGWRLCKLIFIIPFFGFLFGKCCLQALLGVYVQHVMLFHFLDKVALPKCVPLKKALLKVWNRRFAILFKQVQNIVKSYYITN